MADALCGPSNALQTFKQHTSVDRTLQQDRTTSRQSPTQNFRSSLGPNVGALDHEFDAFQAGHAGPSQPHFQQFPPPLLQQQHQHQSPAPFAHAPAGPDWASDFQRLNIAPQHLAHVQQQHHPQASNAAASWHQDFINQPTAMQGSSYAGRELGGMGGAGMGAYARPTYGGFGVNHEPMQQAVNGKQRVEEAVSHFDDAAFERAFEQAQNDMIAETEAKSAEINQFQETQKKVQALEEDKTDTAFKVAVTQAEAFVLEEKNKNITIASGERQEDDNLDASVESDPVLCRIRDKQPSFAARYMILKIRSEIDLGRSAQALPYLHSLEHLEMSGALTADANEAKWCVAVLQKSVAGNVPQELRTRAESLIKSINERLMSSYPLLAANLPIRQESIWDELRAEGYITPENPLHEYQNQGADDQKEETQPQRNDDDDMAETAGRLLGRVSDNTSEKFQNSQFLELMRRLRDREVRVEGDKMVEVSAQSPTIPSRSAQPSSSAPSSAQPTTTSHPAIDPTILNHAAQDFGMPLDSSTEFPTDVNDHSDTDQFRHYNVNSTYNS